MFSLFKSENGKAKKAKIGSNDESRVRTIPEGDIIKLCMLIAFI